VERPEGLRSLVELVKTYEFDRDPDGRRFRVEIFRELSDPEMSYFTRCCYRSVSEDVDSWLETHEARWGPTPDRVLREAIIFARAYKIEPGPGMPEEG